MHCARRAASRAACTAGKSKAIKTAHCSNTTCSSFTTATLVSFGTYPGGTSITIGVDGLGLISYGTPNLDLRVAHCSNTSCSSATHSTVAYPGAIPYTQSIATGADGLGRSCYHRRAS